MTKPAYVRLTIQEWTAEVCYGHNINPECLMCRADMVPGYAIHPGIEGSLCSRPRIVHQPSLTAEDIEIIYVLKCPKCGHSEEIDQEVFNKAGPPPGFTTWNQFWASPISTK